MRIHLTSLLAALALAGTTAAQTTDRASLGLGGEEGTNISYEPAITADGRFVVFETSATNLIPGDANANRDILVRDLALGTTAVISLNSAGEQSNLGAGNHEPDIDGDGRYVVFKSWATNFGGPADPATVSDIFLRDRDPGGDGVYDEADATTTQVSLDSGDLQPNAGSYTPKISGDGTIVAFGSGASDLVAAGGAGAGVFVRDLSTGTNELVAQNLFGVPVSGSLQDLSRDGRHVLYSSADAGIVSGDTNGMTDLFVFDRLTDTTARVSVADDEGEGSSWSNLATISADGRWVAFYSNAPLVAGDVDTFGDIYLRDRDPDEDGIFDEANATTEMMNRNSFGVETMGATGATYAPFVSDDGRFVAFSGGDSSGSCCDLVMEDGNGVFDLFLRDVEAGVTTRISVDDTGVEGGSKSWGPSLSEDGSRVAFSTWSSLDGDDTNGHEDIYVRDRRTWTDIGWNMTGSTVFVPSPFKKCVPTLTGAGSLADGSACSVTLKKSLPGASSWLVVGYSELALPFKGGTLVPAPDLLIGPLPVSSPPSGFGEWTLPFTWPSGIPSGFTFWNQAWVIDAAGPKGFVSSNGLKGVTP
jgi:Tol biopolymer transport system component